MRAGDPARGGAAGYLILGALFVLIILGAVSLATWRLIHDTGLVTQRSVLTDRAYQGAIKKLLSDIVTESAQGAPGQIAYRRQRESLKDVTLQVVARSLHAPVLDLDGIFLESDRCEEEHLLDSRVSFFGRPLSPRSMLSTTSCIIRTPFRESRTILHRNMVIPGRIVLHRTTSEAPPTLIAAAGFIESTAPIEVGGDTIILAGGDLSLHSLISFRRSAVTLVSATGDILVEAISPLVELRIIGSGTISLPPNVTPSQRGPAPPFLDSLVLGVSRGGE